MAQKVVGKIAQRVLDVVLDNEENYVDVDLLDIGNQDELLRKAVMSMGLPNPTDDVAEILLNHPELERAFDECEMAMDDYRSRLTQHKLDMEALNREYVRDVL